MADKKNPDPEITRESVIALGKAEFSPAEIARTLSLIVFLEVAHKALAQCEPNCEVNTALEIVKRMTRQFFELTHPDKVKEESDKALEQVKAIMPFTNIDKLLKDMTKSNLATPTEVENLKKRLGIKPEEKPLLVTPPSSRVH